jgi:hypothetical protein
MALYDLVDGLRSTAPAKAIRWFERMRFCHEHPAYKFSDFDHDLTGADFQSDREYHAMTDALKDTL